MFRAPDPLSKPDREFAARGFRNTDRRLRRTNYFSTFQASDDNLAWALRREADAMTNSSSALKVSIRR